MINLDALIGIEVLSVLIMTINMIFCIMVERRRTKRIPGTMLFVCAMMLELVFIVFSMCQHIAEKNYLTAHLPAAEETYLMFRGLSNVTLFLLLMVYVLCVVRFLSDTSKAVRIFTVTSVAGCCVVALAFAVSVIFPEVADAMYYIDTSGAYHAKAFYLISGVVFYIAGFMIFLSVKYFKTISKPMLFAMLSFIMCPTLVLVLQFFGLSVNLISPATTISFVFMFCSCYMWQAQINREQLDTIADTRLMMLQNQISPHFFYNTLNVIYFLCGKDPKAAQVAISNFSEYMRANLENIEGVSLIPLDKELETVEHYLELEKLRYGDNLEIVYDIDFVDVAVPPMSVQVLAENAVKHGIGEKWCGTGRVIIRTRRMAESDLIIVEDNGVGFDVKELDGDTTLHVGIRNVRERLHRLLGATLLIESEIGKATVATISIPRKPRVPLPKS